MTFLAPGWIALGGVASLAVVAIHFIAWRLPRAVTLPTARFVPDEPARLAARSVRLADIPLLALRVACLMIAGFAMARPAVRKSPQGTATVIVVERRASGDTAALRDNLRALPGTDRTTFVVFDTAARTHENEQAAFSDAASKASGGVSLTVGLLAAIREAGRQARQHESVRIVLASGFSRASFDQATNDVRATWRDSIQIVRLQRTPRVAMPANIEIRAADDDPVAAGIRLAESGGLLQGTSRVVRDVPAAGDSGWVTEGRTLVIWPRARTGEPERVDAVHAAGFTAIGHFIQMPLSDSGTVIARWANGSAAAHEMVHRGGCVRTIAFDVPDAGDFVLTPAFQRMLSVLVAPCGGIPPVDIAPDSAIRALAVAPITPSALATPDELREPNRLAAALMVLAFLLALTELALRQRLRNRTLVQLTEQSA